MRSSLQSRYGVSLNHLRFESSALLMYLVPVSIEAEELVT